MKGKQPTPKPSYGSISAGEVMPMTEFQRRFGLAYKSMREAQQQGLRTITLGRRKYVLGSDVLAFFEKLAAIQDNDNQQYKTPGAVGAETGQGESANETLP